MPAKPFGVIPTIVNGRPLISNLRAEHVWIEIVLLPVTVTDDRDRRVAAGRFLFR